MTFGAWLRARRAVRRETQEEVAAVLLVSSNLVASWEAERLLPNKVEQVLRLSSWSTASRAEVFELVARDLEALLEAATAS